MPRKATGKPLTFRPIRLDDDVWAECQRLGRVHGTINEGLRAKLIQPTSILDDRIVRESLKSVLLEDGQLITPEIEQKIKANVTPRTFKGALLKPKDRK